MDERAEHEALERALLRCAELVEAAPGTREARVVQSSRWSVAQQVDHILRAGASMLKAAAVIARRRPGLAEGGGPNPVGRRILASGRFPRGVGEAPALTQPADEPGQAQLRESLERMRSLHDALVGQLGELGQHPGRVEHPYFGPLGADHWLRVARVHTEHHLAIVDEILREARP